MFLKVIISFRFDNIQVIMHETYLTYETELNFILYVIVEAGILFYVYFS